jgi:hypothetical protein
MQIAAIKIIYSFLDVIYETFYEYGAASVV